MDSSLLAVGHISPLIVFGLCFAALAVLLILILLLVLDKGEQRLRKREYQATRRAILYLEDQKRERAEPTRQS